VAGEVTLKSNEVWKGCVTKDSITSLFSGFGDVQGTDNIDNVKYHGNPFSGWKLMGNRHQ